MVEPADWVVSFPHCLFRFLASSSSRRRQSLRDGAFQANNARLESYETARETHQRSILSSLDAIFTLSGLLALALALSGQGTTASRKSGMPFLLIKWCANRDQSEKVYVERFLKLSDCGRRSPTLPLDGVRSLRHTYDQSIESQALCEGNRELLNAMHRVLKTRLYFNEASRGTPGWVDYEPWFVHTLERHRGYLRGFETIVNKLNNIIALVSEEMICFFTRIAAYVYFAFTSSPRMRSTATTNVQVQMSTPTSSS